MEIEKRIYECCKAPNDARVEELRELLEQHPYIDINGYRDPEDQYGDRSVHAAALVGNLACLKALYKAAPNAMDATNDYQNTSMTLSAWKGHAECTKFLLLEVGVNPNHANKFGNRGVIVSAWSGELECLKVLVQCEADLDVANVYGNTACMLAVWNGHVDCLRLLLDSKADINLEAKGGTAVCTAAWQNQQTCLRLLLERKADIGPTKSGETAAIMATSVGHSECLELLIQAKADVNHENEDGFFPLAYAAALDKADCFELLVRAGARKQVLRGCSPTIAFALFSCHPHAMSPADLAMSTSNALDLINYYQRVHTFVELFQEVFLRIMSRDVVVDKRIGLGSDGLYQEPLERVLEYCGLSMELDQPGCAAIDGSQPDPCVMRVLLPGSLANGRYWCRLESEFGGNVTRQLMACHNQEVRALQAKMDLKLTRTRKELMDSNAELKAMLEQLLQRQPQK